MRRLNDRSSIVYSARDYYIEKRKAGIEYDGNKRKSGPPGRKKRGKDAEKNEQEPWAIERFRSFKDFMASGYADFRQNHAEIDTIPYPQKCRKSAVSGRFFYFQHCGGIGKMAVLTRRFTILVVLCNDRKAIVTE